MLTALAKLLSSLASNASLCAIVPYDQASVLYNLCDTPAALLKSKDLVAPEILQVVRSSLQFNNNSKIVKFIQELCKNVLELHLNDREYYEANPISASYNPEKGVAYYFTPSEQKV